MAEAPIDEPVEPKEKQEKLLFVSNPPTVSEPTYRLQTKESAKGFRYYEWTVKADTLKDLKEMNSKVIEYVDLLREEDANTETDIPDRP